MTTMRGSGSDLVQRLNAISEVEKSIGNLLRHAQTCISELSKEKQISKTKMEESSQAFKKTLMQVEKELSEQMLYLSNVCVGSAHQGFSVSSNHYIGPVFIRSQETAATNAAHLSYVLEPFEHVSVSGYRFNSTLKKCTKLDKSYNVLSGLRSCEPTQREFLGSTFASQQNIALAEAAELDLHRELTNIMEKHFGDMDMLE